MNFQQKKGDWNRILLAVAFKRKRSYSEENMTQHPFEREFSEQEAAKLNTEQEQTEAEQELTDEDMEQVAGGSTLTTLAIGEEGGRPTWVVGEQGGGISKIWVEAGKDS